MSSFKDPTATTSNLTGVSDDSGDNHEDDSGQFDEDEDDYKDYKEPKEEELSLLGNSESNESIPVPIIRSASRHKHYSAGNIDGLGSRILLPHKNSNDGLYRAVS